MSLHEQQLMRSGGKHDVLRGLADASPFVFSLLLSFTVIGLLAYQQGLSGVHSVIFSGALMSAPLQMTLLEAPQQSLSLLTVLLSALSINLRFLVFTLSLRSSMRDGPLRGYIPALLVMANAAFTLMSLRRESAPLTRAYCNTVSFTLYAAALCGTLLGYLFASLADRHLVEHMSVIIAIFIASSLGKLARDRHQLLAQAVALLACFASVWLFGAINLLAILTITLLLSYLYDR